MEDQIYSLQYQVEQRHWWFAARKEILLHFLERKLPHGRDIRLLDVGCGTGAMLEALSQRFDAVGLDSSEHAAKFCRSRGLANVRVGTLDMVKEDEAYDLVTMLDVVEHVDDDDALVKNAFRLLRKGGHLLITAPAFPLLWSQHDVVLHHKRRYVRRELRSVVQKAGFHVDMLSYFNTLLFPVAVTRRLLGRILRSETATDLEMPAPAINAILRSIFLLEKSILPRVPLPFGLSFICWGYKRA